MKKRENAKEKSVQNQKRTVIYAILMIIFLVLMSYIVMYVIEKNKALESKKLLEKTPITIYDEEKVAELSDSEIRMLKVLELKKTNNDIQGWLEIEGTSINYPVLQCDNNEFYVTHDYTKNYNQNGALFIDKAYDSTKPSVNMLIYGHNNSDEAMFGGLMNYKVEQYYLDHPFIRYTTGSHEYTYEIISTFYSRVYYASETNVFRYYFFVNGSKQEFESYVFESKKASIYDTGKTATWGDELITLSTCSYHVTDGRFVVVAKKIVK